MTQITNKKLKLDCFLFYISTLTMLDLRFLHFSWLVPHTYNTAVVTLTLTSTS